MDHTNGYTAMSYICICHMPFINHNLCDVKSNSLSIRVQTYGIKKNKNVLLRAKFTVHKFNQSGSFITGQ